MYFLSSKKNIRIKLFKYNKNIYIMNAILHNRVLTKDFWINSDVGSFFIFVVTLMRDMFNIAACQIIRPHYSHVWHRAPFQRDCLPETYRLYIVGSYACPSDFRLPLPLFRATPSSVFVPFEAFLVALVRAPLVRLSARIIPTNCCCINVIYSNVYSNIWYIVIFVYLLYYYI